MAHSKNVSDASCEPKASSRGKSLWSRLGPGLITGASDDDPSGIATYSQAGAAFGYGLLWTMLVSLPLMSAIQEISARIGRVSGHGIAGNIRRHYSPWLLHPIILVLVLANTINLGADLGAMGDAVRLVVGGPALVYSFAFAILTIILQVFGSYKRCSSVFKLLAIALASYILTAFIAHVHWPAALKATIVPTFQRDSDYWGTFVAVLGTTISPYLFFWQASMETEEIKTHADQHPLKKSPGEKKEQLSRIRLDTFVGMSVSNIVAYFIILAAAATLNAHGIKEVQTSEQAAEALKPILGNGASILFAIGIIGTGLLAVPALAGSAAYAVGEARRWRTGMDRKPGQAVGFYSVLTISTILGLAINFPEVEHWTHLTPIRALFWSAVINGISAVPIMVIIMLMARSRKVMKRANIISPMLAILGWCATLVMAAAAILMLATLKSS